MYWYFLGVMSFLLTVLVAVVISFAAIRDARQREAMRREDRRRTIERIEGDFE